MPPGDGPAQAPGEAPPGDGSATAVTAARALLEAEQQRRVGQAQRLIRQALAETGCLLVPEITISGERISATIRIVPRGS